MKTLAFLLAMFLLCHAVVCVAQNPTPMASGSDEITQRLQQLEAETQALRAEVERLHQQPVRLPPVDATAATAPTDVTAISPVSGPGAPSSGMTLGEVDAEIKKLAWKKGDFAIIPYGCLWANMVGSTERTYPGSYTLYVLSESSGQEGEYIVDARNTRLGTDVLGPRIPFFNDAQSGGKVEIDFQQSLISTENKASVMLRHAYAEVKDDNFRLVAGQTWDVISPLNPSTLLFSVGWDSGNIGYRRAQLRGERFFHVSDTSLVTAQLSANQNVFADSATSVKGETSNWPIVEGRLGWTIGPRTPGSHPIVVGVSGHIGEEEYDIIGAGQDNRRRTWSGNADIRVPLTDRLGVQGELYVGENLDSFFGGIGQGLDYTSYNTIRDAGGWFEVWYLWTPKLHSHIGYSVDNPNDHDLHTVGERSYNQFYYGNLIYDFSKTILVGLEVSSWNTLYVGQLPGDAVRTELVLKYGF
ncbi:MAG: hypothetical protein ABFC63_04590 [Thermoguttaceae bacterium]